MTAAPTFSRVSVIIPYFDQQDDLDRTLAALATQTYPLNRLEIIVVDDGSPRPPVVPEAIAVLRQDDLGFRAAAARNLGVRHATGEVLCFLDADCAPEPDYIAELTRRPALVWDTVVVGRRRHADLSNVEPGTPLDSLPASALLDDPEWLSNAYLRSDNLQRADARSYRYIISAVAACTSRFFAATGGFDETFVVYGGEDWEWAWRCWQLGATFAHVPTAIAWHNGPDVARRDRNATSVNDETRTLQQTIPIPGSRPHALLQANSDVAVILAGAPTDAQAIICIDSVLRQVPTAHIYLESALPLEVRGDPRISTGSPSSEPYALHLVAPARIESVAPLRQLLDEVGVGATGDIRISDDLGVLLTLTSSRVAARRERWGDSAFEARNVPAEGIARRLTDPEPSLAAYYGDWD
jgi:GT2 family glycosyltransferase